MKLDWLTQLFCLFHINEAGWSKPVPFYKHWLKPVPFSKHWLKPVPFSKHWLKSKFEVGVI